MKLSDTAVITATELARVLRTFATTRHGGVSQAPYDSLNLGTQTGDDPKAVAANRRQVEEMLPDKPLWLAQEHGAEVFDADRDLPEQPPQADAAVTTASGQVLA